MKIFVRTALAEEECNDTPTHCYEVEKELIDNGFDKHRENLLRKDVVTTNNYFRYNFLRLHSFCRQVPDFMWQTNKDVEWSLQFQKLGKHI